MPYQKRVNRINNSKSKVSKEKTVWISVGVIELLFILDQLVFRPGTPISTLVIVMLIPVIGGFFFLSPGEMSMKFREYGFWNYVIHLGKPNKKKKYQRRRSRTTTRR